MIDTNEMPGGSSMAAVAPILSERVKQLQLAGRLDGDKKRGGGNAWLPWILCILMAAAYASAGLRYYRGQPAGAAAPGTPPGSAAGPSADPAPKKAPAKAVAAASAGTGGFVVPAKGPEEALLESKGYIIPAHQISVSPIEVSGRIVELFIEEGKAFKKNEVLAAIEDTGFRADFEEAKASLSSLQEKYNENFNGSRPEEIAQARADLDEARANLKQYKLEWDRYQGKTFDALARRDFDQVESSYRGGIARVAKLEQGLQLMVLGPRKERTIGAKADVEAAQARFAKAKWKLENCTIRSPVNGVILSKKAEYGTLINPVVGGVSTSLCEIADLSDLEVDMEIQERDIAKIKDGQYCELRSDAYPDRKYEGYVDRAMPIGNRARGIIPIRVKVVLPAGEKQGAYLKPEMAVSVTFFNRPSAKWPAAPTAPGLAPAAAGMAPAAAPKGPEPKREG